MFTACPVRTERTVGATQRCYIDFLRRRCAVKRGSITHEVTGSLTSLITRALRAMDFAWSR